MLRIMLLLDGSVQSDDNLFIWQDIDVRHYYSWLEARGYIVKVSGSSNLKEHGYVRFLQNDIGRIRKNDDKCIYVGSFPSRYVKMIHLETGGETLNWSVTGELEVDRMLSKLASFGEHGASLVETILTLIRNVDVGRQVIRAVKNISSYELVPNRHDIVGFHPSWLSRVVVPDLSL